MRARLIRRLKRYSQAMLEEWGKNGAKSISDLMAELKARECELIKRDGQIVRIVFITLVDIEIRNDTGQWLMLVGKDEPASGHENRRPTTASIAIRRRPREEARGAGFRALDEKLGIKFKWPDPRLIMQVSVRETVLTESDTFPGLVSEWWTVRFRFIMPDEHYRELYVEKQKGKVTIHTWRPREDRPEE